jgi:8-oxo-dGTP diphosphatase
MTSSPAGAAVLFVNARGQVLLRKRGSEPGVTFPGPWDTVGGAVEPGEHHEQTAVRETAEEIGLVLRDHAFWRRYQSVVLLHIYAAPLSLPVEQINLTEGERVDWLDLEQAADLPLLPWVRALLPEFFVSDAYRGALRQASLVETPEFARETP